MIQTAKTAARCQRSSFVPDHPQSCTPLTIACYENEIPPFAGAALERLYGNLYSSLAQMEASGTLNQASTYVVNKGNEIVTVFLFRRVKGGIEVLNEAIRIDGKEIARFAKYMFATFPAIQLISFRAIQTDLHQLPFACQRLNYLEDIVADLPRSVEAYTAGLGKKTRGNMRRYLKLIKQDFPSFKFEVLTQEATNEALVRDIIALSKARMSFRNKPSPIEEPEILSLVNLVKQYGFVGVVTIDGRVAAGAMTCRVGDNYFLRILAHDPVYNKYSLGKLCCYLTISESIKHGGREFHFLWGRCDYKFLFSGVLRDLDYLAIYRSRIQFILHGDLALKAWIKGCVRQAKLWLHDVQQQDGLMSRLVTKLVTYAHNLKRKKVAEPVET